MSSVRALSPRSVNLTVTMLGSMLDSAMQDGLVVSNVAKLVERPSQPKRERCRPGGLRRPLPS